MAVLKNRAKMSTSTTGTGTITLGSAEDGYQTFADAGVANANVVRYVIEDGNNFEIGTGTYTATGTTLSRTVSESSNSDAAINLSGSATVFIGATAEDIPALYADNPSSPTAPSATGSNSVAIGSESESTGTRSISIGTGLASGGEGIALGSSTASGSSSFAAGGGGQNTASGVGAMSIGAYNTSSGTYSVAIGYGCTSNNTNTVAIGRNAIANDGQRAVSLGKSYASGTDSFAAAIATNSGSYGATGANSIALGYQAKASGGNGSVAIGLLARADGGSNYNPVALGQSYASGLNSFAAGGGNSSSSYGAKGENSIAIGSQSMSQGTSGVALGSGAQVYSGGLYGYAIGRGATVSNDYGYALGYKATTRIDGQFAFSGTGQINGHFGGTTQSNIFVLKSDTTDATAEALTTDNATATTTNQIVLQNESAMTFTGTVVVREDASDGDDYAGWEIKGVIMRQGAASDTTLGVGIVNDLYHTAGLANAAVALSEDTTNGGLKIQVTGIASTNLIWVATVHTSEVVNT